MPRNLKRVFVNNYHIKLGNDGANLNFKTREKQEIDELVREGMAEPQRAPKDNYVLPKEKNDRLISKPDPNTEKIKAIRRFS